MRAGQGGCRRESSCRRRVGEAHAFAGQCCRSGCRVAAWRALARRAVIDSRLVLHVQHAAHTFMILEEDLKLCNSHHSFCGWLVFWIICNHLGPWLAHKLHGGHSCFCTIARPPLQLLRRSRSHRPSAPLFRRCSVAVSLSRNAFYRSRGVALGSDPAASAPYKRLRRRQVQLLLLLLSHWQFHAAQLTDVAWLAKQTADQSITRHHSMMHGPHKVLLLPLPHRSLSCAGPSCPPQPPPKLDQ